MPSARAHARLTSTGVIAAPEQDVVAGSLAEQARGSSAFFVQQDRRRPLRQEREPRRGVCAGRLLTRSLSMARGSARRGSGCLGVLNNVPRCRPPPPPSSSSTSCTKHAWRHALCAPVLLCQNGHRRGTTVLEFQCGGTAGELLDEDLHRQPRPRRSEWAQLDHHVVPVYCVAAGSVAASPLISAVVAAVLHCWCDKHVANREEERHRARRGPLSGVEPPSRPQLLATARCRRIPHCAAVCTILSATISTTAASGTILIPRGRGRR